MEFFNKIQKENILAIAWHVVSIGIAILFIIGILTHQFPLLVRPISQSLRSGFGVIVPFVFVVLYVSFRVRAPIGNLLSLIATTSLFAMPLAGLWASGQSQSTVLSGLIPLYDAEAYYIDALRLLDGNLFSIFSARRPLFPALLAVLLFWTNYNLMMSLAILTALVGFACYYAVREIQRTHGAEVAIFTLIILFLFYRAHSGVSMSEHVGVALGVLGFALLWQGASGKNLLYWLVGIFSTTLALNARAGAFFVLPLLVFWAGRFFRDNKMFSWKAIFFSLLAVVCGFVLNLLLTRAVAIPSGVPFANFSYTFYGLASGGNSWVYVFEAHPEVLQIPEPERNIKIYQLAFELIRSNPSLIVQGTLYNWKMLFSNSWYSMYSYVGGENWQVNLIARWVMYFFGVVGLYACIRERNDAVKPMVLCVALGIFLSVPFLPPTDAYRMRPYAVSIIVFAVIPAFGFDFILRSLKINFLSNKKQIENASLLPLNLSMLIIFMIMLSVLIKAKSQPISLDSLACKDKNLETISVRFSTGTFVYIQKQNLVFIDWLPNYHIGLFKRNAHSLAHSEMIQWANSLQPPFVLFTTLDFNTYQKVLVVINDAELPVTGKYYQLCGLFENNSDLSEYRIFYANEVLLLSP